MGIQRPAEDFILFFKLLYAVYVFFICSLPDDLKHREHLRKVGDCRNAEDKGTQSLRGSIGIYCTQYTDPLKISY